MKNVEGRAKISVGNLRSFGSAARVKNKALYDWIALTKPPLSVDEEAKYIQLYKDTGDPKYREIIISRNQRFVLSCANVYTNDPDTVLELVSEGLVGLVEALERFDLTVGVKFCSFAVWYIKRNMTDYLVVNSKLVHKRLPANLAAFIKREKEKWLTEHQGYSSVPDDYIKERIYEEFGVNTSVSVVQDISAVSIDALKEVHDKDSGDDRFRKLEYFMSNKNEAETNLENEDNRNTIRRILAKVCTNELEHDVICHAYGVLGYEQLPNESIATKLGVAPYAVQYIQSKMKKRFKDFAEGKEIKIKHKGKYQAVKE